MKHRATMAAVRSSFFAVVGVACVVASPARAEARCKPVHGKFTATQTSDLPNFADAGRVVGGIQGHFAFTLTDVKATPVGSVFLITGTTVIQTREGDLTLSDAGAVDLATGNIVVLETVVGGTGALSGASGELVVSETFDFNAGTGEGHYRGEICTP